jgi:lipopolysaccharide/colanic/teichoic acid biosynthesis glycosyltransferase
MDVEVRAGAWPAAKRIFDIAASATALLLLAPVLAVIGLLVRIDSSGPVLFRQTRVGAGLEDFTVLKFRTMHANMPDDIHRDYIAKLAAGEAAGDGLKKLTADPRVTRVGRTLRKTSLDELPQLVNVLRGSMSLVGPRPALRYELDHYEPRHYERFSVKPGITGLWQVSGRNQVGFHEMLDLDVEYARRGSLLLDLKILVKTPVSAVTGAA